LFGYTQAHNNTSSSVKRPRWGASWTTETTRQRTKHMLSTGELQPHSITREDEVPGLVRELSVSRPTRTTRTTQGKVGRSSWPVCSSCTCSRKHAVPFCTPSWPKRVSIPAPSNGTRLSRHEEDEEAQAKNGHKRKLDSNSVQRRLSTIVLPAIAQTLPLPRPKALRSTVAATPPYPDTDLPDGVETEVSSNAASNLEASGMQHCVEFASYDDLIPTHRFPTTGISALWCMY